MWQRKKLFLMALFLISFKITAQEKLLFSVDLIRHGDRTPILQIPASPYPWQEGLEELTAQGRDQEKQLGKMLRKKYIEQYHLLPACYARETLAVRSTDKNRTIQSADALLLGLYPLQSRCSHDKKIPILVVPYKQDFILVNKPVKNPLTMISLYFKVNKYWKEKTAFLQEKLKEWSNKTGLTLNNFQTLVLLGDNLHIRKLHHVPFPKGITEKDADTIIALGQAAMIKKFQVNEITQVVGRAFLSTVENYMNGAKQHASSLKYVLFSAHDSTIMSVLNTMGVPLTQVPGYASRLNFSLFEKNKNFMVKISFNDKPVNISLCGGNECTWAQFEQLIKQLK